MFENVVYPELLRCRYSVNIGKTPNGEIDLQRYGKRKNDMFKLQRKIKSTETRQREYDRLLEIDDNYPKQVLMTDDFAGGNYKGIQTMHVADFLLSKDV